MTTSLMNEIINEFINVIRSEAYRFKRAWGDHIYHEAGDLVNEGVLEMVRCRKSYNQKKGKFSTYLTICLRTHYLSITRKDRKDIIGNIGVNFDEINLSKNQQPVITTNLSKNAQLFLETALQIPDGLLKFSNKRKRWPYQNCVGYYLGFKKKEIDAVTKEIKAELFM